MNQVGCPLQLHKNSPSDKTKNTIAPAHANMRIAGLDSRAACFLTKINPNIEKTGASTVITSPLIPMDFKTAFGLMTGSQFLSVRSTPES